MLRLSPSQRSSAGRPRTVRVRQRSASSPTLILRVVSFTLKATPSANEDNNLAKSVPVDRFFHPAPSPNSRPNVFAAFRLLLA